MRREISYVGPPQKPNLSCMNWSHKFHYFGIMKKNFILTYEKSKEMKDYLKTGIELKPFLEKTGFLKFIWKLESQKLFENWSLGN